MDHRRRARAGFTLVETIGAVVIAALLLAAVVPAVTGALRVRQAEAVLRNDLHNAANAFEEAHLGDGAYPAFRVLEARGFRLSPRIAVDSQAVDGERVYLRLRHEPTGQRCALDYSRSSPLARNRADCYGGGQARDTAVTVTAEGPSAPPADTFGFAPPGGGPPEAPLALAAPSVEAPADLHRLPGEEVRASFTVTNRGAVTRTFRLEAGSSDPALLPAPGGVPERLTLLPGVPTPVQVATAVADVATANAAAALTLRATDEEDGRWSGMGSFAVTTGLVLAAPAVRLEGDAVRTEDAGRTVDAAWTVTNRTNVTRMLGLTLRPGAGRHLQLETRSGDGLHPFAPGETRAVSARLRLDARAAGGTRGAVALVATDAEAERSGEAELVVETRTVLAAPELAPPPDRSADPGSTTTGAFRLVNRSNVARTFTLAISSDAPAAVPAPGLPAPVAVPAGGSVDVPVAVRVDPAATGHARATVTLRATDADAPVLGATAGFAVQVNVVRLAPALAWAPGRRTLRPGAGASDSATVTNRSNVAEELCFAAEVGPASAPAGRVIAPTPAAPACRTLGPAGTAGAAATVPVAYSVAAGALAGTSNVLALTATARGAATPSATAGLVVEAALVVADPVWVSLPVSPMEWDEGEERTLGFTLRNASNAPRRFCVAASTGDPRVVSPAGGPVCGIRVDAGDTARVPWSLRAAGAGSGIPVTVVAHDQDDPGRRAEAAFLNRVRPTRPTAVWDAPAPVYVRRWAEFDGGRSWSPVGSPVVRYLWTWGLVMQRWDPAEGRFVLTEEWGTARDEVAAPRVERAYDIQGTFEVCLTVEDAEGRRSEPNCQAVTTLRSTAARVAWRYRGWWTYEDWCLDVWWNDQCDREHGNARWEIDLRPSLGDAGIREAEAEVRVRLHNTDDPDRSATVTFAGDAGTAPAWGAYAFGTDAPEAVGSALLGRWRVLSTRGTGPLGWPAGPRIADHPLVLNVNLASATGMFDGGPHWVPDEVWVTLRVQDADGRWTRATAYHDHDRGSWRQAYDTVATAEARPVATLRVEQTGADRYRATGGAESAEGRVVETGWELTHHDLTGRVPAWTRRLAGDAVEVAPGACERIAVAFRARDDRGVTDVATEHVTGSGGSACAVPGGPVQ